MRDDAWLRLRLEALLTAYFPDLPAGHPIDLRFGRPSRRRFGSIAARDGRSHIRINRVLASPAVPEFVVDATLLHEIAHYVHGFGSGLPKRHRHPHAGGVVAAELEARNCGGIERLAGTWRAAHWEAVLGTEMPGLLARREASRARAAESWRAFWNEPGRRGLGEVLATAEEAAARLGLNAPPFRVEWFPASLRQRALSYRTARSSSILLHGLASDPVVPEPVIRAEIAFWFANGGSPRCSPAAEWRLLEAGFAGDLTEAERFRRHAWPQILRHRHPLRPAPKKSSK